jgi:hypothetical protein
MRRRDLHRSADIRRTMRCLDRAVRFFKEYKKIVA